MVFVAGAAALGWTSCRLADQGVANLLGLETLRHGTNLINYLGIKTFGGLPSHGFKSTGSTKGFHPDNTTGAFYTFKDSEWDLEADSKNKHPILSKIILNLGFIFKRVSPIGHSGLAGYNATLNYLHLPSPDSQTHLKITNLFIIIIGTLGGLVTMLTIPTIKFRLTPNEIKEKFNNDPSYDGMAYKTAHKIDMWKIGVLGTMTQGLNLGVFRRIAQNPCKSLTGVVQLTAAVGLGVLGLSLYPAAASLVVPATIGMALLA